MLINIYNFISTLPLFLSLLIFSYPKLNNYIFYTIILFFIFFLGLRDYVGPDWYVSVAVQDSLSVTSIKSLLTHREPLDSLTKLISGFLGLKMYGVNFFYVSTSLLIFILTFNKLNSNNKNLLLFSSIPFLILFLHINSPRQAMIIFMLIPILFLNKNFLIKFILFFLSFFIHNSAIIFLPILLFDFIYENRFLLKKIINKYYFFYKIIYFSLVFCGIFIIFFLFEKIYPYVEVSFLYNSISSPAYYFRLIYFSPFILIGIYFLFRYEIPYFGKIIICYFIFLYFLTFLISFISTTVSDRLNFFLFLYTLYIFYIWLISFEKKMVDSVMVVTSLFSYNLIFFIIWSVFSESFKTWIPYKIITI